MILIVRYKNMHYRRFREDIWGFLLTSDSFVRAKLNSEDWGYKTKSWVVKFFYRIEKLRVERWLERRRRYVYRIDLNVRRERYKRMKKRFVSVRLTRLYFITLRERQFRVIFRRAAMLDGNMQDNFLHAIEGRLVSFLYRCHFFRNFFEILDVIKQDIVIIRGKRVKLPNIKVPLGEFVRFEPRWHGRLQELSERRTEKHSWMFPTPRYIFLSFHFWYAYLLGYPEKGNIVYPFNIDIQRLTGYF